MRSIEDWITQYEENYSLAWWGIQTVKVKASVNIVRYTLLSNKMTEQYETTEEELKKKV